MAKEPSLAKLLSSMNVEDKTLILFVHEIAGESVRGGLLIAAAHLDELLLRLLVHFMVQDKHALKMFAPREALGDFSAKIDVAYGFGLISANERHDLHVIRKIRNLIAHRASLQDEMTSIRDQADNLTFRWDDERSEDGPEKIVRNSVISLMMRLAKRIKETSPRLPAKELCDDDLADVVADDEY